MDLIAFTTKIELDNFTLIIPSISVANVSQLTIDLLITSKQMKRIAILWDAALVPCVGSDPFDAHSPDPCTACEMYANPECKLAVIQLRSTIESTLALQFFTKLVENVKRLRCKEVVILTSAFAHELHDINSSPFRFISNNLSHINRLIGRGIREFAKDEDGNCVIYGGGFASKLYELMRQSLPVTVLIKYASEGDNRPDGLQMLQAVNNLLNFTNVDDVKYPDSWAFVFGNPPPIGLF